MRAVGRLKPALIYDAAKAIQDRNSNALYRTNEVNHNFDELYHASGAGKGYDNLNQLSGFLRGVLTASGGTLQRY
jgi:hypothetical protein